MNEYIYEQDRRALQMVRKSINMGDISERELDSFMNFVNEESRPFRELMTFYTCAAYEIETKFKVLNEQMSLEGEHNPIETIKTRIKSVESIIRKMNKLNLPLDLDEVEKNIYDVAGVRVICAFPEDIYFLADCLLQQDDIKLIEKKDYIANPKPSGYRSLHLIVEVPIFLMNEKRPMKVEVQLRTIAMDFWASLDHKLRYKKNIDPAIQKELSKQLWECAEKSAELDLKMQAIRKGIEDNSLTNA